MGKFGNIFRKNQEKSGKIRKKWKRQCSKCPICKKYDETQEHILINCEAGKKMWDFVQKKLRKLCNHREKITQEELYRGNFENMNGGPERDTALLIMYKAAKTMWDVRNRVYHDKIEITKYTCLNIFLSKLRLRIKADHKRMSFDKFEKYWKEFINDEGTDEKVINIGF